MWKTPPGFYCRIQDLFRATIDIAQLLKSALYVNATCIYSLYKDLLNREKRHQKKILQKSFDNECCLELKSTCISFLIVPLTFIRVTQKRHSKI